MDIQDVIANMPIPEVEQRVEARRHVSLLAKLWPEELKHYLEGPRAVPLEIKGPVSACPNCHGSGLMQVFLYTRGPFSQPNGAKVRWLEGEGIAPGYYIGETKYAPCPACQEDGWRAYLEANCGLRGIDLETSLEGFVAGGPFWEKEAPLKVARQLLAMNAHPKGFITFWGLPGRGKTHVLKALVNGFRLIGLFSRYVNAADLVEEIKSNFTNEHGQISVEEAIRHYRRMRVLAIDELDKVSMTPWVEQTLHRLLDSRSNEQHALLTLLAMNENPENLPSDLGYLASRIKGGVALEIRGSDMRDYKGASQRRIFDLD